MRIGSKAALSGAGLALLALSGASTALAQSGSVGGSIGKQDKSLSGGGSDYAPAQSRAAPAAPRERPVVRPNYDGTWMVQSTGQNCSINTSGAVIISGSRVIAQGGAGTVSASGAVRTVQAIGSITATATGQIYGRVARGSFRQSDGCVGSWIGAKQ